MRPVPAWTGEGEGQPAVGHLHVLHKMLSGGVSSSSSSAAAAAAAEAAAEVVAATAAAVAVAAATALEVLPSQLPPSQQRQQAASAHQPQQCGLVVEEHGTQEVGKNDLQWAAAADFNADAVSQSS